MRELKFRAWDKVEKKMLFDADPFALHVSGSNEPLLAETHRNEDCIFEQYTGLKDKNGRTVYEGDILKFENSIFKVGWFSQGARFGFSPIKNCNLGMGFSLSCSEVIGNIHENHELLEGEE